MQKEEAGLKKDKSNSACVWKISLESARWHRANSRTKNALDTCIWSGQVVIPDGQKTNHIQFQHFKCLILFKSPNGAFLSRKWHDHCNVQLQVGASALLSFLFWAKSWCGAAAWSLGILKGGTPTGCLEARLACPRRGCSNQLCTDGWESASSPVGHWRSERQLGRQSVRI